MTQIQAYENMSKEALIEHHLHTLQQHADDMDMLSKELASRQTTINGLIAFIQCDASAATYQSLGQYRTAIIQTLRKADTTTHPA